MRTGAGECSEESRGDRMREAFNSIPRRNRRNRRRPRNPLRQRNNSRVRQGKQSNNHHRHHHCDGELPVEGHIVVVGDIALEVLVGNSRRPEEVLVDKTVEGTEDLDCSSLG